MALKSLMQTLWGIQGAAGLHWTVAVTLPLLQGHLAFVVQVGDDISLELGLLAAERWDTLWVRIQGSGSDSGSESKESTCNAGDLGLTPSQEDPLEKGMATHSSILAWRIPWTEEPGGLQSMGSQIQTRLSD